MQNISEKDLYMYVMHPEVLSEDIVNYINDNFSQFKKQIEFLNEFKNNSKSEVSDASINEIFSKIEEQSLPKEIILHKIQIDNQDEYLVLAADSPLNEKNVTSQTFIDSNGSYLVKVITSVEKSKIFILNSKMKNDHSYNLTINPSKEKYQFNPSEMPLIVKPLSNIKSILLEQIF